MKNLLLVFTTILMSYSAFSQTDIIDNDLVNGKAIIESYISPFAEGIGASLNNGWYNTAKPHKLGGFDITFTLNTVIVPANAKSFNINKIGGESFSSTSNSTPTILGKEDGSTVIYHSPVGNQEFKMPDGVGLSVIPLPMLQAGVGLIKKTEIDIRFVPSQKIGNLGTVNLIGFGAKHDILQWIPFIGDAIPISLSLQGGYTNLHTNFDIQGQEIDLDVKATTINLVASRKILMLTGYAGIGYNSSVTTFSTDSQYAIGVGGQVIQFDAGELANFQFASQNEFRANIGLRFNITVIAIQANYTLSKYPTATVGLGVSLR